MTALDEKTIKDLETEKIAKLIEQILTNTVLHILSRLDQRQKQLPSIICYKTDCFSRDDIPF